MSEFEKRLKAVEDRLALQDALTAYCRAVDSLSDLDGLLDCFTEDAVFDLRGIDLPKFEGRPAMRGFFERVFADMSHHAHFATNFAVDGLAEDAARCRAYVMGMGATHDGNSVLVYVKYFLDFVRTGAGWKIRSFGEAAMMPLPGSLTEIHGQEQATAAV